MHYNCYGFEKLYFFIIFRNFLTKNFKALWFLCKWTTIILSVIVFLILLTMMNDIPRIVVICLF